MSNKPVYFSSLEVENVKCFGTKQTLDLKTQDGKISPWTLILGNNGLGKTTLLKCLAWMDTVEETDSERKKNAGIPEDKTAVKAAMDGLENDSEYEQLARIGTKVTSHVKAQLSIGTKLGNKPRSNQLLEYAIDFKTENGKLTDIIPYLSYLPKFVAPRIYGYSASRHMELKNIDSKELIGPTSNLFSESGELFDATEQLLHRDHAALQNPKGPEKKLLEKIKQLLVELLPGIENSKDIIINAIERTVKVRTSDGEVPLNNLSLGYKTMVAWTVDLALKMLYHNQQSENPLEEPSVVIIDEIDLHLHPKWQRIIRRTLTNTFTNTQFICTAHSPFMAQASENENLCVLNREGVEVIIKNEPLIVKGWRIDQVITSELFGITSERSPEIETLIEERRILLDKGQLSRKEHNRLDELNVKIDNLPVFDEEDDKLIQQIRNTAALLRNKGIMNDTDK